MRCARCRLLVPGAGGRPAVGRGLSGARVVWAFGDEEAYQAWLGRQDPAKVDGWAAAEVGGHRKDLGALLTSAPASSLVVNPAGPGTSTWPTEGYLRGAGSGLLRKARPARNPWPDPAA